MALSLRCPHCGKAYVLRSELAGRRVRCRQCQKEFIIPAAKPDDGEEEPILLSLAEPEPPAAAGTFPGFNQALASGPATRPPGQEEMLAVGTTLPLRGEAVLAPVAVRRRSQAGNSLWRQWLERLLERKLTAAVAVTSLGLLFVFILLSFAAGLSWLFVIPVFVGGGLVVIGMLLPLPKRAQASGPLARSGGRTAGNRRRRIRAAVRFSLRRLGRGSAVRLPDSARAGHVARECNHPRYRPSLGHRRVLRGVRFGAVGCGGLEFRPPVRFRARLQLSLSGRITGGPAGALRGRTGERLETQGTDDRLSSAAVAGGPRREYGARLAAEPDAFRFRSDEPGCRSDVAGRGPRTSQGGANAGGTLRAGRDGPLRSVAGAAESKRSRVLSHGPCRVALGRPQPSPGCRRADHPRPAKRTERGDRQGPGGPDGRSRRNTQNREPDGARRLERGRRADCDPCDGRRERLRPQFGTRHSRTSQGSPRSNRWWFCCRIPGTAARRTASNRWAPRSKTPYWRVTTAATSRAGR